MKLICRKQSVLNVEKFFKLMKLSIIKLRDRYVIKSYSGTWKSYKRVKWTTWKNLELKLLLEKKEFEDNIGQKNTEIQKKESRIKELEVKIEANSTEKELAVSKAIEKINRVFDKKKRNRLMFLIKKMTNLLI